MFCLATSVLLSTIKLYTCCSNTWQSVRGRKAGPAEGVSGVVDEAPAVLAVQLHPDAVLLLGQAVVALRQT